MKDGKEASTIPDLNQLSGYNVVHVYADSRREWNTSQWRALTPSSACNTRPDLGWSSKLIHVSGFLNYLSPQIQHWCGPCDLIIFERNAIIPRVLEAIQYWRGMGKPVVIGLDDAYWMLPYSNPARAFWFEKDHPNLVGEIVKGGATQVLEQALREADGLIAPNRLLLQDYAHLTKNSYYLQNYAEERWWVDLPDRETIRAGKAKNAEGIRTNPKWVNRTIIGWGGSISHLDSWFGSGIFEAARRVTHRHPELLWLICGNDRRIEDTLPIPEHNKAHQPGVPPERWPLVVKTFDIGLAPLWGIYDQRRSWIKGIEYALAGVPWVGTKGETYRDIKGWPTGWLGSETADFWEETLETILNDLNDWQAEAEALIPKARKQFLATQNLGIFSQVYGQILQDFRDDREGLPDVIRVNSGKVDNGKKEDKTEVEPLPNVVRVG